MKKFLAILLTLVMVCSLSVSTWAAPKKLPSKAAPAAKTAEEAKPEAKEEGTEELEAAADGETVLNWEDVQEAVAEIDPDGNFYSVADYNLKLWIPSVFEAQELEEEDIEGGIVSWLMTDDAETQIILLDMDVEGMTLEELKDYVEENYEVEDAEIFTINGLKALGYTDEESDIFCIDFETTSGHVLEFEFWPASDEDFFSVVSLMAFSIQPLE